MLDFIHSLAILLTGFSLFAGLLVMLSQLRVYSDDWDSLSRSMAVLLLLELLVIQASHYFYLQYSQSVTDKYYYLLCLYLVAPSFYLFSRNMLLVKTDFTLLDFLHFLPALVFFLLPQNLQFPIAFVIGGLYLVWLFRSVYVFRASRVNFKLELLIFGLVFIIALVVIAVGIGIFSIPEKMLIQIYAILLGCIFFLIALVLMLSPRLLEDISEFVYETYANSTLANIDVKTKTIELKRLLETDKLFLSPDLDLSKLASKLHLSSHQLSELINSQYGIGFSRYIREYRINEAKSLLVNKPSLSIISIGLDVGFASQSNFYQAFKEITGISPGKFRKMQLADKKQVS